MSRRKDEARQAAETLEEIESVFDRAAGWATENPGRFLGGLGLILAVAGGIGVVDYVQKREALAASEAVAQVRSTYEAAMGAQPGALEIPEPANPEIARGAREEAVARYLEVAEEHAGSAPAVMALLDAAKIQQKLGETQTALETYARAVEMAPDGTVEALALARHGLALEEAGSYAEAAEAYERATEIEHPLRWQRLADAARARAAAGDRERAVAHFDRLEMEAPETLDLAPYLKARLEELRYAQR